MIALPPFHGRIRRTLWSLAAAVAVAATAPASAQFGLTGGIGDAFRPAFVTRDIQLAVDMLELDEAQQFILETFFEDYQAEFRTGVDAFRDRIAAMRSEIDPNNPDPGKIMRVVFGTIDEWREESRQLAEQFVDDLKGLLNEEQLAKWPQFERKLFRLKYLKNGQLPAEDIDLIDELRDAGVTAVEMEAIRGLVTEYELALDRALRAREDYLHESQSALMEAVQGDFQRGVQIAERQVELRKGVRDVNEDYTRKLAEALPDELGEKFLETVRRQTYPRVYRTTPAERAFAAAVRLEELEQETLEAVEQLQRDFLNELEAYNDRLVQVVRQYRPKEIKNKVEMAAARLSGQNVERLADPTREEFAKRGELGDRYMDLLKALLTPEQFASLPGARRWLEPDERELAGSGSRKASEAKRALIEGKTGAAGTGRSRNPRQNTQDE